MSGSARDRIYTDGEIVELLEKANAMGLDLTKGSELEDHTIEELERMVNTRQ